MKQFLLLLLTLSVLACGGGGDPAPTPTPPTPTVSVATLVKKVWSVNTAQWDGVTKYDKAGTANVVQGYSQYKLDLSTAGSVTLTEFDGKIFTGTYTVATDGLSLTLNGLTSAEGAPTGTGGTITYTILSTPTATGLSLQQTAAYVKASSAIVKLVLVNP
ncbi:hypothetical protein [Aquirufa antheringensis]|jgi:hypothetical protein|uniref:Lipocalin-like domain-containing protein n=1 Tax=Aquirufa antheringensis TaxID=2516559 RepID=A0A4Q9BGR8_9BACT|nr:hypothetical protein [Aquirufa antheringensis]MCZ2485181.1 hypothetical protein [Aquirufa antheringensis]MCZ2487363.1 hypothetical protein [Aquirufa antheringensis]MCZ2490328.1 hypothetical protein [Aquirufa antheringensis]TBH75482.1 hypothetical protein EWU20_02565 [Aquirufa antheringensis]USQ03727.1 hypothetical protein G9X63_06255 [Aquirufa antheringensis]